MTEHESQYEKNYQQLMELLGPEDYRRIRLDWLNALNVDRGRELPVVWLSQDRFEGGERLFDPMLCFRISDQKAKPISYFNSLLGIHLGAEFGSDVDVSLNPDQQRQLDRTADSWLFRLQKEGYFKKAEELNNVARRANPPVLSTGPRETTDPETAPILCSIESGQYRVNLHAVKPSGSETWQYCTSIYRGEDPVYRFSHGLDVLSPPSWLHEDAEEGLTARQFNVGLSKPQASIEDVHDLMSALKVGAKLVARFAERGHEAVLRDRNLTELLEPRANQSPTQKTHTMHRGR
jgi:hypothetical protein